MGAYHLNEDGQRLLQGFVPDGFLDAQGRGGPANPLSSRRRIFERKTLASLLISVQERVRQVQRQSWCAAQALFRQDMQRLVLLFMRGWSQLIIERFRDAVTNRPFTGDSRVRRRFGGGLLG